MTANSCSTSPRSRLEVGSSRMSTFASSTIARLMATSCWIAIEWLDSSGARVDVQAEVLEVARGLAVGGLPVDAAGARAARGRA